MKKVIQNTVLAVAMIAFGLSLNAKTELSISGDDDNTVTITLEKKSTETSLVLKDKSGMVMYQGNFDNGTRNLNLKELPDGTYFIIIEDAFKWERSAVIKENGKLKTVPNKRETVFKPTFVESGKMLRMSMTNPKMEKVIFHVYDPSGDEVATSSASALIVKKTFDFGHGSRGNYLVETKIGDHTFSKTVRVN